MLVYLLFYFYYFQIQVTRTIKMPGKYYYRYYTTEIFQALNIFIELQRNLSELDQLST